MAAGAAQRGTTPSSVSLARFFTRRPTKGSGWPNASSAVRATSLNAAGPDRCERRASNGYRQSRVSQWIIVKAYMMTRHAFFLILFGKNLNILRRSELSQLGHNFDCRKKGWPCEIVLTN